MGGAALMLAAQASAVQGAAHSQAVQRPADALLQGNGMEDGKRVKDYKRAGESAHPAEVLFSL